MEFMRTNQRILFVEDEDAIVFSYRKLLQGAHVEVDDCPTLDEAISLIRDNDYNAIITDFRLSHSEGNEGMEILRYAKVHSPETPVILLTGSGGNDLKEKALALGARGYFNKPVQVSTIITFLREMGIHAGLS
jgi:DNA-binding NtrC family response regulator